MTDIVDKRSPDTAPEYEEFRTLLDRILVRRLKVDDEVAGFAIPEKFRQHSNWGEVVVVGDGVVLGGELLPLDQFISVGDRVRYGEYTAEQFSTDDESLWIVRLQDCRGVRRRKQ